MKLEIYSLRKEKTVCLGDWHRDMFNWKHSMVHSLIVGTLNQYTDYDTIKSWTNIIHIGDR